MGIGRRAVALSLGFRTMVEQCNSLCALSMVRMQLDTVLRLYAGFFVNDHQQFCSDVLDGKQINTMKSREGYSGPNDYDREPKHFLEPMQCMLRLNEIIKVALLDWFERMCDPDDVKMSI
jgi:hypothetical protein